MNIILIAPPAGGKGTLASKLKEVYGYAHISTGQMLRDVDPESSLGKEIREAQSEGRLVDDRVTNLLLKARLQKDDIKKGFVLDGYPRSFEQVRSIEEICTKLELEIDVVVYITLPFEDTVKRILGRLTCPQCNKIYNKFYDFLKPKNENLCDECGVGLESRNDDNEESLKKRFDTFNEQTLPIIEYYKKMGKVIEIESQGNPDDTFALLNENLRKTND